MRYVLWVAVSRVLRVLPLRVAYGVASLAGSAAFFGWRRGRRATLANFRVVLGPAAADPLVRRVARRSLVNYCRSLVDFARLRVDDAGSVADMVDDRGAFAKLRRLQAERGPVILVSLHFGNWDAGAIAAAQAGFGMSAVADGFGDRRLDEAVLGARERTGVEIIRADSSALGLVRALRRGRNLALVVDRPLREGGVEVEFFGRTTRVPSGAARLALRMGRPVVAAACYRVHSGKPELELCTDFDIVLPAERAGDAAVRELTQSIFRAHERIIRQRPAQWYMFRQMWPDAEDA